MNFFLGCVGVIQVSRIFVYQRNLSAGNVSELVSEESSEVEKTAKDVVEKVKKAATGA